MSDILDDIRDRTIFVEYYPDFCITSVWHSDGKFDYCVAVQYATA